MYSLLKDPLLQGSQNGAEDYKLSVISLEETPVYLPDYFDHLHNTNPNKFHRLIHDWMRAQLLRNVPAFILNVARNGAPKGLDKIIRSLLPHSLEKKILHVRILPPLTFCHWILGLFLITRQTSTASSLSLVLSLTKHSVPFKASLLTFTDSWRFAEPCCLCTSFNWTGRRFIIINPLSVHSFRERTQFYFDTRVHLLSIGVENTGCKRQMTIELNIAVSCGETQESRTC